MVFCLVLVVVGKFSHHLIICTTYAMYCQPGPLLSSASLVMLKYLDTSTKADRRKCANDTFPQRGTSLTNQKTIPNLKINKNKNKIKS